VKLAKELALTFTWLLLEKLLHGPLQKKSTKSKGLFNFAKSAHTITTINRQGESNGGFLIPFWESTAITAR